MEADPVLHLHDPTAARLSLLPGAFSHGPFLVKPDGALVPRRVPALRFSWRDRPCEARLSDGKVTLAAAAGAIPYTAERGADRPAVFAQIKGMAAQLPMGWRLDVLPNHCLRVETQAGLAAPVTAVGLVAALVSFVLTLDPYLDRLESGGAGGAAMAGTVKT